MKFSTDYERVLVDVKNVQKSVEELKSEQFIGLDFEAFGLEYDARMFSMILAGSRKVYYFNFYSGTDFLGRRAPENLVLRRRVLETINRHLFKSPHHVWMIHNAKYDMHRLAHEGYSLEGTVHCTYATERVLQNNFMNYSLGAVAERYGMQKDDTVDEYIKQNKLYTWVQLPGKKKREKHLHFEKVPFGVMTQYGCHDGYLHRTIGIKQLERLSVSY